METRERLLSAYRDHLLEHGGPPASVFKFTRDLGLEERAFFAEFPNFDALESEMWRGLVARVAGAVVAGPEWAGFTSRQRLLTFLFAFCEESLAWRSLLLQRVERCGPIPRPARLRGLELGFKEFIGPVIEHGHATGEIAERGMLREAYPEAFFLHFRAVVDFHLKDASAGYERTDAFIEKSVALAFDLLRTQAFDSALDFAKFVFARPA